MLHLRINRQPEWIDTGVGVRLHVAPLTSAVMLAVKSDLRGTEIDAGDIDRMHYELVRALARRTILDWEGVGDEGGNPVAVTPAGIDALLDLHRIFDAYDARVVSPYLLVQSEKNVSAPSPNGISAGAGPTIATPARASAPTARPA